MSRRIAVILGGRSSENPISLASAASVITALEESGNEVVSVQIDREGRWELGAGTKALERGDRLPGKEVATTISDVDVVFPVLHGPFGEDGTVQGLLELANVPYVGAGVLGSALCMDKDVFKAVLRDRGVPVTENITLRLGDEARNPFDYPVFVKPARLGSSVGITKAHDEEELRRGVALAFEHDEKVLVERFVSGVEVEVGVLGNQRPIASLPGEIVVTHNEWYDYEAKYDEGEMDLVVPARLTDDQIEQAQELAVRAFVATECEGMARADMFVRDDGEVLVNELNTIPGFTATSVYARLFEASGIGYAELLRAAGRPGGGAVRTPPAAPLLGNYAGDCSRCRDVRQLRAPHVEASRSGSDSRRTGPQGEHRRLATCRDRSPDRSVAPAGSAPAALRPRRERDRDRRSCRPCPRLRRAQHEPGRRRLSRATTRSRPLYLAEVRSRPQSGIELVRARSRPAGRGIADVSSGADPRDPASCDDGARAEPTSSRRRGVRRPRPAPGAARSDQPRPGPAPRTAEGRSGRRSRTGRRPGNTRRRRIGPQRRAAEPVRSP